MYYHSERHIVTYKVSIVTTEKSFMNGDVVSRWRILDDRYRLKCYL